jgi:hypothetical protein
MKSSEIGLRRIYTCKDLFCSERKTKTIHDRKKKGTIHPFQYINFYFSSFLGISSLSTVLFLLSWLLIIPILARCDLRPCIIHWPSEWAPLGHVVLLSNWKPGSDFAWVWLWSLNCFFSFLDEQNVLPLEILLWEWGKVSRLQHKYNFYEGYWSFINFYDHYRLG